MRFYQVILIFAISFVCFSHSPPNKGEPSNLSSSLVNGDSGTTGGYGNIAPEESRKSEASNIYDQTFSCPSKYAECYLAINPLSKSNNDRSKKFKDEFLTKLAREKYLEYNILSLSANTSFNKELCQSIEKCNGETPEQVANESNNDFIYTDHYDDYSFGMKQFKEKFGGNFSCVKRSQFFKK